MCFYHDESGAIVQRFIWKSGDLRLGYNIFIIIL